LRAIGCFEAVRANGIDTIGIEIRDAEGKEETGKITRLRLGNTGSACG